jgi:hypothetical protein
MGHGAVEAVEQVEEVAERGEHQRVGIQKERALEARGGHADEFRARLGPVDGVDHVEEAWGCGLWRVGEEVDGQRGFDRPKRPGRGDGEVAVIGAAGHVDHAVTGLHLSLRRQDARRDVGRGWRQERRRT